MVSREAMEICEEMTGSEATIHVADIWTALETCPPAAANLRLRAKLMIAISEAIAAPRSTRTKTAAMLGISVVRLAELVEGDIDAFSVDDLVAMAEHANLSVDLTIVPRAA